MRLLTSVTPTNQTDAEGEALYTVTSVVHVGIAVVHEQSWTVPESKIAIAVCNGTFTYEQLSGIDIVPPRFDIGDQCDYF